MRKCRGNTSFWWIRLANRPEIDLFSIFFAPLDGVEAGLCFQLMHCRHGQGAGQVAKIRGLIQLLSTQASGLEQPQVAHFQRPLRGFH